MNRRWLRYGPWIVTLVGVLLAAPGWSLRSSGLPAQVGGESGERGVRSRGTESVIPSPDSLSLQTCACERCESEYLELTTISRQAAALTGLLALVDSRERAVRAAQVAPHVRHLAGRAAGSEAGDGLADVLHDLAAGLERYAQSDLAALVDVQDASVRNARLRSEFQSYIALCKGGH
jgi:hypothetical protein